MKFERGERVIEVRGRHYRPYGIEELCVNDSSIWTRLVQEAGRKCDSYASDILLDWKMYKDEMLACVRRGEDHRWLFGFRSSGVDHTEWVEQHTRDYGYYISVFAIELVHDDNGFTLTLRKVA
jgi:hypothetical protein